MLSRPNERVVWLLVIATVASVLTTLARAYSDPFPISLEPMNAAHFRPPAPPPGYTTYVNTTGMSTKFNPTAVLDPVPPPDQALFQRYFDQLYGNKAFAGSAALYKDGTIYTAATGFLDETETVKVDTETQFRFGSITKTVVAVAVMKAVEDGLLALSDPLSKWFPVDRWQIKSADQITLALLMNHRSMLFSYTSDPTFILSQFSSLTDIVNIAVAHQDGRPAPDSTAGEYCNTGFYLLGRILEATYGIPLQELLNSTLSKPLGMDRTGVISPYRSDGSNPDSAKNHVSSFTPVPGGKWEALPAKAYSNWSATAGAGAMTSTPSDMIKFYLGVFVERQIITLESIRLMQDYKLLDSGLNYGFGIFAVNILTPDQVSHHGFGHNGVLDGFMSQISIAAQNRNGATQGPETDPLLSPFIIYVQSTNAFNFDLAAPIIAMNHYGQTGVLAIPQFPRDLAKYATFTGNWVATEPAGLQAETTTVPITVTNWKPETEGFEEVATQQLTFHIVGQSITVPLADITNPNQDLFTYAPLGLYAQFIENGQRLIIQQGPALIYFDRAPKRQP